jgi:hypothetical protein
VPKHYDVCILSFGHHATQRLIDAQPTFIRRQAWTCQVLQTWQVSEEEIKIV